MALQVIELFSGAGLFGSGFVKEGFQIVQAVEIDTIAASTYQRNLDLDVDIVDIKNAHPRHKCDVIIAGPPCQGFSTLGKRLRNDTRNTLSLEIVRWAQLANPAVIVVENVSAFLQHPVWFELTKKLKNLGYSVEGKELNALDFGIPQARQRSFTIASKIGVPEIHPLPTKAVRNVWEAWQNLPLVPDGHNHHYAPQPSSLALARMKVIPEGGDRRDVMRNAPELVPPSWWRLGSQITDVWGRMTWGKPSNTLRTSLQNASKGRYIHPNQNRVISLREAARLHSIDDSWVFEGLPTQVARQIGNSVPPRLSQAVARSIRSIF